MAVMVQLREFNGSQVRIPDGESWETDADGQLIVWSAKEPPPTGWVAPASERMLALFADGTWLYARWEEPGDGDTVATAAG